MNHKGFGIVGLLLYIISFGLHVAELILMGPSTRSSSCDGQDGFVTILVVKTVYDGIMLCSLYLAYHDLRPRAYTFIALALFTGYVVVFAFLVVESRPILETTNCPPNDAIRAVATFILILATFGCGIILIYFMEWQLTPCLGRILLPDQQQPEERVVVYQPPQQTPS